VGDSPECASCSGGPATICTPINELQLAEEVHTYWAWMWKDGMPAAHNGYHY
jgi:hypothetical protein